MMKQKTYQHPFDCILIGTSLNMKILCDSGCEHIVKNYDTKYQCIPYKVYNQYTFGRYMILQLVISTGYLT